MDLMIKLIKIIAGMRFFVLVPFIGLAIASDVLFIKGTSILFISSGAGFRNWGADTQGNIIVDLVEIVHFFLVETVLLPISLTYFMKVYSQIKGNETENRKDSNG